MKYSKIRIDTDRSSKIGVCKDIATLYLAFIIGNLLKNSEE
jgi:hypothetical protein